MKRFEKKINFEALVSLNSQTLELAYVTEILVWHNGVLAEVHIFLYLDYNKANIWQRTEKKYICLFFNYRLK